MLYEYLPFLLSRLDILEKINLKHEIHSFWLGKEKFKLKSMEIYDLDYDKILHPYDGHVPQQYLSTYMYYIKTY